MKPGRARATVGLVVLLGLASPAAAQDRCGGGGDAGRAAVSGSAGVVRYDLAGNRTSDGIELGLEAAAGAAGFRIRAGVHRVLLGDAPTDPMTARLRVTREVVRIAGIGLCGVALAGGSIVSSGSGDAFSMGGGIGVTAGTRFAAGPLSITPFLGTRVLGARSSGDVLGQSFSARGGSVGVEGGVGTAFGRTVAALRFSMDGFDPALGATPYPPLAVRLSAGWRF